MSGKDETYQNSSDCQMCHCEAVELCIVFEEMPCFHGDWFGWWTHNRYEHHSSPITFCNAAHCLLMEGPLRV